MHLTSPKTVMFLIIEQRNVLVQDAELNPVTQCVAFGINESVLYCTELYPTFVPLHS